MKGFVEGWNRAMSAEMRVALLVYLFSFVVIRYVRGESGALSSLKNHCYYISLPLKITSGGKPALETDILHESGLDV